MLEDNGTEYSQLYLSLGKALSVMEYYDLFQSLPYTIRHFRTELDPIKRMLFHIVLIGSRAHKKFKISQRFLKLYKILPSFKQIFDKFEWMDDQTDNDQEVLIYLLKIHEMACDITQSPQTEVSS